MTTDKILTDLSRLAVSLHQGGTPDVFWQDLEKSLANAFGHRLFTVLAYDESTATMARLYSNRPDINPVGGRKRVTESVWSRQVLERGEILVGSTRDDLKAVFSDHEVLWRIGCESVLNIPVRKNGVTLGSLNLLDDAHRYDHADLAVAMLFAQLAITSLEASAAVLGSTSFDPSQLETV